MMSFVLTVTGNVLINGGRKRTRTMTINALQPRLYESADAEGLDRILDNNRGHDVRLDRDQIVVVGAPGRPVGCLAWRPGGIVHELFTGNGLASRYIADLLVEFAVADAIARPFDLWEAIFMTDSDRMAEYVLAMPGALEETGKRLITVPVRTR